MEMGNIFREGKALRILFISISPANNIVKHRDRSPDAKIRRDKLCRRTFRTWLACQDQLFSCEKRMIQKYHSFINDDVNAYNEVDMRIEHICLLDCLYLQLYALTLLICWWHIRLRHFLFMYILTGSRTFFPLTVFTMYSLTPFGNVSSCNKLITS